MDIHDFEWAGPALLAAAIALLGYVGKAIAEAVRAARDAARVRRAELVELHSLLGAARVTFLIQNDHARALFDSIRDAPLEGVVLTRGFEAAFASAADHFSPTQQELHQIIRGMTIHAMHPTNRRILAWLQRDRFFKAHPASDEGYGRLARSLAHLEAHLVLWQAKYHSWIPDHPEHALVYLDDEKRHGLGFPPGVDTLVASLLGLEPPGHGANV